ncbi:MAG: hypothetical protein ACOH1O_06225 [Flavobacterium sp.]
MSVTFPSRSITKVTTKVPSISFSIADAGYSTRSLIYLRALSMPPGYSGKVSTSSG